MTNKLNELFPKAETVFKNLSAKTAVKSKITIPKVEKILCKKNFMPKELMFLQGGENSEFWKSFEVFGLKEDSFLGYLESDKFYELLKGNRMSILIKTRSIFFSIILIVRRVFMTFSLLIKTRTKITRDGIYIFCRLQYLCFRISNGHKKCKSQ